MTHFITARGLLLALALALAAGTASARSEPTAARETAAPSAPDGVPIDGLIIIAGIVAVVILLAWVCSRVSDTR